MAFHRRTYSGPFSYPYNVERYSKLTFREINRVMEGHEPYIWQYKFISKLAFRVSVTKVVLHLKWNTVFRVFFLNFT